MKSEKAFELFKNGILKKGCKVKINELGFNKFTIIDDVFIHEDRPWVMIVINKTAYHSSWIDEIEGYEED